jgi:hypothetical protein
MSKRQRVEWVWVGVGFELRLDLNASICHTLVRISDDWTSSFVSVIVTLFSVTPQSDLLQS